MKKTFIKILSVVLCAVMVLGAAPLGGLVGLDLSGLFNFKAEAASYSGKCGTNLTWSFDTETGVLNISGTGAMTNYSSYSSVPWYSYRSNIKTVNIASGVTTIGDYAFAYCSGITSITIPDSVTTIGDDAFYWCTSLTSVTIPDSVTTIGDKAFPSCTSLTSVTIPDSVTTIGYYAFYNCYSLTSITIPESVTTIGYDSFAYCTSLTSITVDEDNKYFFSNSYGVLFNKDKNTLIQYPVGNTRTSYTIPDSVTTIGSSAFSGCTSLTSITIPDNVTTIGDYAFYSCDSLTSVTIGNSVTTIGNYAFCYCDSLTSITIPDSVKTIGDYAFYDCDSLTSVTIPDNATTIGAYAFVFCTSLTSVTIGNSVTTIGDYAFSSCISLTSVTIPDSVTSIGYYAFSSCISLTSVTIPDSVTIIGGRAFKNCTSLTSVTIPDSVTTIGYGAFEGCDSLTDVYYSGTLEQWEKISVGVCNVSLLNATIHYNSTGPENDNASGNEPSDEEKYKNATITLDKDSYTVKEPNLLKITGKIICPDGVESLSVDTSYSSADFYLFSLNYEMISNTEKIFVATFSAKNPGEFKIGFLFPDLSKSVKCTVKSYKEAASAFVDEHYQFVKSDKYNSFVAEKTAQELSDALRGSFNYHWNNAISWNFFENYYDLVFAELLTGKTMTETAVSTFNKNCAVQTTTISNEFLRFIGEGLKEDETKKFLSLLDSKDFADSRDNDVYKELNLIIEANKSDITESFFAKYDIIGASNKILSVSSDYVEWAIECIYFYSAVEAYRQTNEEFKTVIKSVSEKTDNKSLKKTLETYISIDEENSSLSFAQYVLENRKTESLITMVKIFFDIFGIDGITKFICDINLKDGSKLADKVVKVFTKEGTKVGTIAQYANGAITGITLGMAVSELITNADDYSLNASKCTHAGDLAEVLLKVLDESVSNFKGNKTLENALMFDAAYNLYKDTQIYALNAMVESIYAQNSSAVAMTANKAKSVSGYISKINRYKNLNCHKHDLNTLINAEYYYVDDKYSGNKVIRVACPVDVYVYDSAGNLALSIENDFVEIFDDRLNAYALNSEKYICVPLDEDFTIKIVSTDSGEMDYSVFEFNENSEMTREVSKENISLETNKTFDGKINNVPHTDADNYNLTVSGTQEKIAMENDIDCVPATDIEVSESTVSLKVGQSKTLYATVSPSNTTDKFSWISSDETVATVSENGVVKAIGEGKATIIAIFNDLIYAECEIDVVDSKDYTVCWTVDGVSTFQIFTEGDSITKPVNPEKKGYAFVGWTPEIPTTMPAENLTFTAQFELNVKEIKIKTPSTTTINYGETLVLQLEDVELPEGWRVEWSLTGNAVTMSASADGKECRVTSTASGNVSVTATLVDENGEPVINSIGNEISTFINLKSNANFWQKLVSFFKNLFRINRIIY